MIEHDDWTRGVPRILAQKCGAGHAWYLPRPRCPRCGEPDPVSFEPRPTGTVFAITSLHRRADGGEGPLRIALIDLDDGVRMMARVSTPAAIGSRVSVSAEPADAGGRLLPICKGITA